MPKIRDQMFKTNNVVVNNLIYFPVYCLPKKKNHLPSLVENMPSHFSAKKKISILIFKCDIN